MIDIMNRSRLPRKIIMLCFIYTVGILHCYCQEQVIISIPFKTNSFVISKQYQLKLDTLAEKCKENTNFKIKIYAFTDTTGSEGYNDTLSENRLDAVYDYIKVLVPLNEKNSYGTAQGESEEWYDLHFKGAHVRQRYVDVRVFFYKK